MSNTAKWMSIFALALGAIVVIGILGFVVIRYQNYLKLGDQPLTEVTLAQVSIGDPSDGTQLTTGEAIQIQATAAGPQAFLSMELWVDGVLMGVQTAPSEGAAPLTTTFSWLPLDTGPHALVARAMSVEDQTVTSAPVIVNVTTLEGVAPVSLPEGADFPTVLPAPSGAYSPPTDPGMGDMAGEAEDWSGSPGDWLTSLTTSQAPAAPQLVVKAGACQADLSIRDLSDNEEGFRYCADTNNIVSGPVFGGQGYVMGFNHAKTCYTCFREDL